MDDTTTDEPIIEALPFQEHRCTAAIEDMCEASADDAWDDAE